MQNLSAPEYNDDVLAVQDPTFGVNEYQEPKILSPTESIVRNFLVLLFGRPGFYPSIPTLGLDIRQYLYSFTDDIDTEGIKAMIKEQCSEFIPSIDFGDMDIVGRIVDKKPILVFKLPMIVDDTLMSAVVGVTLNNNGEFVYKYMTNEVEQVI